MLFPEQQLVWQQRACAGISYCIPGGAGSAWGSGCWSFAARHWWGCTSQLYIIMVWACSAFHPTTPACRAQLRTPAEALRPAGTCSAEPQHCWFPSLPNEPVIDFETPVWARLCPWLGLLQLPLQKACSGAQARLLFVCWFDCSLVKALSCGFGNLWIHHMRHCCGSVPHTVAATVSFYFLMWGCPTLAESSDGSVEVLAEHGLQPHATCLEGCLLLSCAWPEMSQGPYLC